MRAVNSGSNVFTYGAVTVVVFNLGFNKALYHQEEPTRRNDGSDGGGVGGSISVRGLSQLAWVRRPFDRDPPL